MNATQLATLTERLDDVLGSELRAVATGLLDGSQYDLYYLRDDLEGEYSTETLDNVYQGVITEYLGQGWEEDRLHRLGRLEQSVFVFDEGVLLLEWYDGQFLFVTFDRNLSVLEDVVTVVGDVTAEWG